MELRQRGEGTAYGTIALGLTVALPACVAESEPSVAGVIVAIMASIVAPQQAQAITCGKASSAVEHLICGDKHLEEADAAMGEAYLTILKATDDPEIRAMLVQSQKRWLKARDSSLAEVSDFIVEDLDEKPGKAVVQRNLLVAIQDRTQTLTERSKVDPKVPRLIEIAFGQRKFASQYTGGPLAGIDTDCGFFPGTNRDTGPYGYSCFATRTYQNKNRVCSVSQDWATYCVYEKNEIADVVGGKLKTIATCGDDGYECPSSGDAAGDRSAWDMHVDTPTEAKDTSSASPSKPEPPRNFETSPRWDADTGPDEDEPWLHACLTDPAYPHAPRPAMTARNPIE